MTAQRQLRSKPATDTIPVENTLTAEQMAAYLRQSSTAQVQQNIESADLQLSGALKYAVRQGLDADKIVVAHEGGGTRGVSGTLRIDQREKLQEIMADIAAGKIKLLWAYSVSRLFRDKYGLQVATFVQMCAEHGVKVVIETAKTFDFTNSFDVLMFQFLANVASRENEDRSKLLHAANNQKAMRGEYHGRPLNVGYIVDRDKQSPTFGKYIPYRPHADVSLRLYERYQELDGRFNLLWHEVSRMPVVFPAFESWVDPRDVSKLQLKKVPGGYHISKVGLFHLLTAVEYAGYWKFDGTLLTDADGVPVVNHTPIVPLEVWLWAFNRLSFVNLDGGENKLRANTKGIVPAPYTTKDGKEKAGNDALLRGLLTSPRGTVQYSNNQYRVTELRNENTSQRSNTLTVDAELIDLTVWARFTAHLTEIDTTYAIDTALAAVKEKNATELVSVPTQIANYEKQIRNVDAWVADNYADADQHTRDTYNAKRREAVSNLTALKDKQKKADTAVKDLIELRTRSQQLRDALIPGRGEKQRNQLRTFADSIRIDEYSGHFYTVTITWRAPFNTIDICSFYREDAGHQEWTTQDEADLARLYPDADRKELLQRFPTRSWLSIYSWAFRMGLTRNTRLNTSGITDRSMCLADYQLMQANGWELKDVQQVNGGTVKRGAFWLTDITVDSSVSDTGLAPGIHLSQALNQ